MEVILDNFTEIFNKQITLHKNIPDEKLRLVYGEFKNLYIVNVDDLINNNNHNFFNMEKTLYTDPLIRFYYCYNDYIIYPYLYFKTAGEMENDPHPISKYNLFLKNTHQKSFLVAKVNKIDNMYYMTYYINNSIINDINKNKRNYKIDLLVNILINQKKEKLLCDNTDLLSMILNGQVDNNGGNQNYLLENILKPDVQLYNYQTNDIKWMETIESNVKNDENIIKYSYSPAYDVLNDKFLLYNYNLFPSGFINETAKNERFFKYYGGNIISEVGLGKTLITLCHVFKQNLENRHLYSRFVEFATNCNYFYKRGKLKGQVCNKQCDGLYCKEHIKTLFIDKRHLVLKNLSEFDPNKFIIKQSRQNYIKTNSTLIICPNQLCDQWVQEYYEKFQNKYRILLIVTYDQYTNLTLSDILFSDIVFVSYNFLLNKRYLENVYKTHDILQTFDKSKTQDERLALLKSKQFNLFHLFHWERVICDEVHEVENMLKGNILKNYILSLQSNFKWNVTGTPFANGLYSFINTMSFNTTYLDMDNNLSNRSNISTDELIYLGFDSKIIEKSSVLFRRNTKKSITMEYSGNEITNSVKLLQFTTQERSIYNSYLEGTQKKYSDFLIRLCCHPELNQDTKEMIKNCKSLDEISHVMLDWNKQSLNKEDIKIKSYKSDIEYYQNEIEMITELYKDNNEVLSELIEPFKIKLGILKRQLTIHKKNYDEFFRTYNYLKTSIETLTDGETCPICLDDIDKDNITITKCGHKFCWDCIYETHKIRKELNNNKLIKCPTCNSLMKNDEVYLLHNTIKSSELEELDSIIQNVKSTKIGNIIHFLKTTIKENDKVILFSQWDELLHKVGNILANYNINLIYCNGSVYQRKRAISSFCKNKNINIILLSSRNAASGINLTIANKIILLEPIYGNQEYRHNIESQAVGRADRIGQKNPIEIYRFIIKDTIEESILNNLIDDSNIKQLHI